MSIKHKWLTAMGIGLVSAAMAFAAGADEHAGEVVDEDTTSVEMSLPEEASEQGHTHSRQGLDTAQEARERGREYGQDRAAEARERRAGAREAAGTRHETGQQGQGRP